MNAMKAPVFAAFGIMALAGCTTTRTLSVSPANPTTATSAQGATGLRSVKTNAVTVWLLTPEYQTDLRKFAPPAFRVLVSNGGDKAFDFSVADVSASSGGNSVHVFTAAEYREAINRQAQTRLLDVIRKTAQQKANEGFFATSDTPAVLDAEGRLVHEVSFPLSSSTVEGWAEIEAAAADKRDAINLERMERLDEARWMLVRRTVAPGSMAGGIVKLDPTQISRGQALKLVITAGGEPHEFIFEVGS